MFKSLECLHTLTGGEFIPETRLKAGFRQLDIDVRGNLDAPIYLATSGSWVCARALTPNASIRRGTFSFDLT